MAGVQGIHLGNTGSRYHPVLQIRSHCLVHAGLDIMFGYAAKSRLGNGDGIGNGNNWFGAVMVQEELLFVGRAILDLD